MLRKIVKGFFFVIFNILVVLIKMFVGGYIGVNEHREAKRHATKRLQRKYGYDEVIINTKPTSEDFNAVKNKIFF